MALTGLNNHRPGEPLSNLEQGMATSSTKGQMVNIFDFVDHTVSVTATQPCCYRAKVVTDNRENMSVAVCQFNLLYGH